MFRLRTLHAVPLVLFLCLLTAAPGLHAADWGSRPVSSPSSFAGIWDWLSRLSPSAGLRAAMGFLGHDIDPNGASGDLGHDIDPDGAQGDLGHEMDPNG